MPDLEAAEPQVADHLRALHRAVEQSAAGEAAGVPADVYGELGMAYAAYGYDEPAREALELASRAAPEDFRWQHYLGALAQQVAAFPEARAALGKARELNPLYGAALVRLAQVEQEAGESARARVLFEEALERGESVAACHEGLGTIAFEQQRFDEAIEHFEGVRRVAPYVTAVNYPLAQSYLRVGQRERARALLEERGEVRPGLDDPLIEALRGVSRSAAARVQEAVIANAAGRFADAVAFYREALSLAPGHPSALRGLATSLTRLGRQDEAAQAWRAVLSGDEGNPVAHNNLGLMLVESNPEEAREHFERALDSAPDFEEASFNLAVLARSAGKVEEAGERFDKLTQAEDVSLRGAAHEALAELSLNPAGGVVERSGLEAGFSHLSAAAELLPERDDLALQAARAAGGLGRHDEAVRFFDRALGVNPSNASAWFGGTLSLLLQAQFEEALAWLERAREALPDSLPLQHIGARLLATVPGAELRDPDRALELAERVLGREQSLPHAETLAMAFAANGDFENAVLWQSRVVSAKERAGAPELAKARARLERYRNQQPPAFDWLE